MKKIITFSLILLVACNSNNSENKKETLSQPASKDSINVGTAISDSLKVDNKKDPICGMPVKGNINDTTFYQGKLYGFCSTECKDEFLKNPKEHIAAAEVK
jgi:YHS domain-containing protein